MRIGLGPPLRLNSSRTTRANYARNTVFAGGAAGVSPTGHNTSVGTSAQAITMAFAFGTESGIEYVDCIYSGTANAQAGPVYGIALDTVIVALPGQAWTFAADLKLVAGALAGITADLAIRQGTAAGAGVLTSATNVTITGTRTRFSHSIASADPAVERITGRFRLTIPISTVVSATIRLYRPQLELGSVATAFIPNASTTKEAIA